MSNKCRRAVPLNQGRLPDHTVKGSIFVDVTRDAKSLETEPDSSLKPDSSALTEEQRRLAVRRAEMEAISEKEMAKKVFDLAWPATVEAALQTTIRMITASLLGHIPGYAALAVSASGLADRVTRLSWGIFAAVGTGSTVMVARSIGAGNQQRANRYAEQALVMAALLITFITVILIAIPEQLINILYNRDGSVQPEMVTMAINYLRMTAWGVPMMSVNQIVGALMRGAGNTKVTMMTNTTANLVNAALGYILIYGNLGAPMLGIDGAAIATVVSQAVGGLMALIIFFRYQTNIQVSFSKFRMIWREISDIFSIGIPAASEQLLMQFGQIALAGLIASMGSVEMAAHTQGITAESLSYMPSMGFGIAATALVGMSVGVGSVQLAQRYVKVLIKWDLILTTCTASLLILAPRQVFSILTNDEEVIALGAIYLIIMGFIQFPQQLTGVYSGALRGGGDAKATLFNSLIGLWGIRIPLSFLFAGFFGWGIISVWWAMAVDLIVRFILAFTRYRRGIWMQTARKIAGDVQ
ncbi:MAG: MATE family efflux transporter [Symbiobacteriaceae bacterium]|nr:MATE family efflux transporter [Symbiobacteriaceae bacterium]